MSHTGMHGPYPTLPSSSRSMNPAGMYTAPLSHEGRAKVLAHNPFSTMGISSNNSNNGSDRGVSLPQRLPSNFATSNSPRVNSEPMHSAAPKVSQEMQQLPQKQQQQQQLPPPPPQHQHEPQVQGQVQQETLSSTGNDLMFPQRSLEHAGMASRFAYTQERSSRPAVDTARPPSSSSSRAFRGSSLNSLHSTTSEVDTGTNDSGVKRSSYLRQLLRREPPDFLKPSSALPVQRQSSTGPGHTHSPRINTGLRFQSNGSAQITQSRWSPSSGVNTEEKQQEQEQEQEQKLLQRQQRIQELFSTPRWTTQREEKHTTTTTTTTAGAATSPFLGILPHGERQNNIIGIFTAPDISEVQAGLPKVLSTANMPGLPHAFSKGVGTSETQLPSGSFGANTPDKSLPGGGGVSSLIEQQLLLQDTELHDTVSSVKSLLPSGVHKQTFPEEEKTVKSTPLCAGTDANSSVITSLADTEPPRFSRKATISPNETRKATSLANDPTRTVPGNLQLPPSTSVMMQGSKSGEIGTSGPFNALDASSRRGLNTPKNGGMNLQTQCMTSQARPGVEMDEYSPAPFPPSRQRSQEVHFTTEDDTSVVHEVLSVRNPRVEETDKLDLPMNEGKDAFIFTDSPTRRVRPTATPNTTTTTHSTITGRAQPVCVQENDLKSGPHSSATAAPETPSFGASATLPPPPPSSRPSLSSMMAIEQPDISNEKDGVSLGAKKHIPRGKLCPGQRSSVRVPPCFALFTPTGNVITLSNSNVSSAGPSVVMKSQRLADVLSGRSKTTKCFKIAEDYVKRLQILASSSYSFISNGDKGVSLTNLQEIVRQIPGLCSLFREVLIFTLQDPPPDWRAKGHSYLIKLLSSAAKELPIESESHPHYPLNSKPEQSSIIGLQRIQQLLCAGERESAVEVALENRLYSHAIIIAMMCPKKEHYMSVIRAVVQQELDPFSPLAHAYCMFNELPLPPFAPSSSSSSSLVPSSVEPQGNKKYPMQSLWVQHAAVLVSNFTKESAEGLIQLGDTLVNEGMIDEAHCCFLLAHVSPMGTPQPGRPVQPKQQHIMDLLRARLGVLGGRYHPQSSRSAFVSPKSTLLTDVLQILRFHLESRTVASVEDGEKRLPPALHGIPVCPERYRAAFHFMQVLWLREVGLSEEASHLMEAVRRVVPPESPSVHAFTLNHLISHVMASFTASAKEKITPSTEEQGKATRVSDDEKNTKNSNENNNTPPTRNIPPMPSFSPSAKRPFGTPAERSVTSAPPPHQPPKATVIPTMPPPPASSTTTATRTTVQNQQHAVPQLSAPLSKADVPPFSMPSKGAPLSRVPGEGLDPKGGLPPPPPPRSSSACSEKPTPMPTFTMSSLQHSPEAPPQQSPPPPSPQSLSSLLLRNSSAAPGKVSPNESMGLKMLQPQPQSQPQSQPEEQKRGRSADVGAAESKSARRSASLEAITNFLFRRGRSEEPKRDEAKKMIIDTEKPPKFDPSTGRYLFEETEEEKKVSEMVKAGPPKPSLMMGKTTAMGGGAPPSMLRPQTGPSGMLRAGAGTLPRAQYVDMFNST